MDAAIKYCLLYPAEALVVLSLLALLIGTRWPRWWAYGVGGLAALAIVVRTIVWFPECFDLRLFWEAGVQVLQGADPYLADVRILNPPTVLPFFAALALLPYDVLTVVWTALNLILCLALVPLAYGALRAQGESADGRAPAQAVALVFGLVAFCYATRRGLDAGQVSLFFTMPLLAALMAQGHGRLWLAGALLAVASVKAATWLPFLLLFLRKRDWPAWLAMAVVGLALSLAFTPPAELWQRTNECLANIRTLSQPGRVNDHIPENTQSVDLLSLEHAFYHLGVTDRTINKAAALGLLGGLTLLVGWFVLKADVPRPAACAAVGVYAMLFLYHRQYDTVMLALPLLYVTGRAAADATWRRWLYAGAAAGMVAVLQFRLEALRELRERAVEGTLSPWLAALVVPYCNWALLIGLVSLVAAETIGKRRE